MFRNYFKTTLRNLWKNKTYSFLNIFGLAVGTLCCVYILLYISDQYSYDKHHKDVQDIYRVTASLSTKGEKHLAAAGYNLETSQFITKQKQNGSYSVTRLSAPKRLYYV